MRTPGQRVQPGRRTIKWHFLDASGGDGTAVYLGAGKGHDAIGHNYGWVPRKRSTGALGILCIFGQICALWRLATKFLTFATDVMSVKLHRRSSMTAGSNYKCQTLKGENESKNRCCTQRLLENEKRKRTFSILFQSSKLENQILFRQAYIICFVSQ